MVRKAYLHPNLTSAELKTRYLSAKDRVESRRWHLLWLVSCDWTIRQASQAVGLNYDYAKDIIKGYNQQGEKAIANRRHQPRKLPSHALLNTEQLEELRCCLKQAPQDKGLWSGPKVADWIAKKTGFAKAVGAGNNKIILLVIDRAGWHMSENVVVPEGIYLEPLPPYSPELQPAERLWQLSDEPLVNKSFDTLSGVRRSISRALLSPLTNAISGTGTH